MLQGRLFNNKGGSLVEIVIVAGIIVSSLAAILGLATFFIVTTHIVQQTNQATALAQELLETVRTYRDGTNWSTGLGALTLASPYHPEQSGSPPAWVLVSGAESMGEFTRQLTFQQVCRNTSTADIVSCPSGSVDTDTLRATATVSWSERGRTHQVELIAYFTNWRQ